VGLTVAKPGCCRERALELDLSFDIFSSSDPAPQGNLTNICSGYYIDDYFSNSSGCRNDRRAYVKARAVFYVDGSYLLPYVQAMARAEYRTGTFCNWYQYSNILYSKIHTLQQSMRSMV
jgi:hypothetical protein